MNYSLGLDIGITSVGWCVLDLERQKIADLGVRVFKSAENPKDGSSPATPRRIARSVRRTLRRRRSRIKEIKRLIVRSGMMKQEQMEELYSHPCESTPWQLRVAGLDRKLTGEEWARVLVHIAKHRGYKFNGKAENSDAKQNDETGLVKQSLRANAELLSGTTGKGYRTVGEMIQRDAKFVEYKRNRPGDYSRSVSREDLTQEVTVLFECQRRFDNPYATSDIEQEYLKIFSFQRPFISGDQIEKMVGRCSLEPDELRAPKASWTAQRFILLSRISNLRLRVNGHRVELEPEKKKILEKLAYKKTKVKYKDIRKTLGLDEEVSFEKLPYTEKNKDPEDAVFIELKYFHSFKDTISKTLGEEYWEKLITTSPTVLDAIASALTYRKDDQEILEYLEKENIPSELARAALSLNFSGNVNLSLKALNKIIPFMETKGCHFDEAYELAGYSKPDKATKSISLSIPVWGDLPLPVGIRAISQVRKVVNAVVRKYGSPRYIQIEVSRDLSKTMDERRKAERFREDRRQQNEALSQDFEKLFGCKPNGLVLEKYRLWKEQDGICPYTGGYIDPSNAFMSGDGSYAEIDHIIPYSRSLDDSRLNRVLVIGGANRKKKDKTPYEYFGGEGEAWETYVAGVKTHIRNKRKIARLLMKDFGAKDSEEMKTRLIDDTRYVARYISDWLEKNLLFADKEILHPVTMVNEMAASVMRRQWGLNQLKERTASDLQHALDACIVAAVTPETIQKISEYSQKRELGKLKKGSIGKLEVLFPEPWKDFSNEIEARLADDPAERVKVYGLKNYTRVELGLLKPVFVSIRPERKAHGAAHDMTIRSAKYLDQGKTAVKTPLSRVTLELLERMVGKERDTALYEALKKRLGENDNNPRKAFTEEFRKPTRDGRPGPVVRSIKIFTAGVSGITVNDGLAYKSGMVRVDMYRKNGRHYAAPYYVSDIARKNNAEVLERNGIDASFEFVCSFFKFDLIAVTDSRGKRWFGYYDGFDTNRGSVYVLSPRGDGKETRERVSVRTAKSFEKFEVDVLGEYHKVRKEKPFV